MHPSTLRQLRRLHWGLLILPVGIPISLLVSPLLPLAAALLLLGIALAIRDWGR